MEWIGVGLVENFRQSLQCIQRHEPEKGTLGSSVQHTKKKHVFRGGNLQQLSLPGGYSRCR